jgi:solute:Na+ symporter, SSS family
MAGADTFVLIGYFAAVVVVGLVAGRRDRSTDDYFLGGRRQPWLVVGLSILATELSAITFIGVPGDAFGGDFSYLQLYVGSFVGRMVIVFLLLPVFYRHRVTTVYEYLGRRFGSKTRVTASVLFLTSRLIGSGLRLLAASIALSVVFGWDLYSVIVGTAMIAIAYTTAGGIKAIIWTDTLQVGVFVLGAVGVIVYMVSVTPSSIGEQIQIASAAGKFQVFHWSWSPNDDKALWVLIIHTLFLNAAVFGTDQDLVQRMLTCSSLRRGQLSLVFNAVIGLPVVVLFLVVGATMWLFFQAFPAVSPADGLGPDRVFPYFIAEIIPHGFGLRGLLVAGVFAAAMSSLDSALGALSSTAVTDFYRPYIAKGRDERHYVRVGRLFSILFGTMLVCIAIAFAGSEGLLWEAFRWAGLIYGSLLGVFLLAVLTRRRGNDTINSLAMLSSVAILAVIKAVNDSGDVLVAWPWWIVIGAGWTFCVGAMFVTKRAR